MVAGALAEAGYFMGKRLHRPRSANPKGFFESPQINRTNDALLRQVVPHRSLFVGHWLHPERLGRYHMWLARVPLDTVIPCSDGLHARMRKFVRLTPYCFKDPRFSYTLPAWRPILGDAVFVCVFRDPAVTAQSIVKECDSPRYRGLPMTAEWAFDTFTLMYRHILNVHRHDGQWLFLHYDQVLAGDGLARLAEHLDADVDQEFPDKSLRRSEPRVTPPSAAAEVYAALCELAEYQPRGTS